MSNDLVEDHCVIIIIRALITFVSHIIMALSWQQYKSSFWLVGIILSRTPKTEEFIIRFFLWYLCVNYTHKFFHEKGSSNSYSYNARLISEYYFTKKKTDSDDCSHSQIRLQISKFELLTYLSLQWKKFCFYL